MNPELEERIRSAFGGHFGKSKIKFLGQWTNTILEADNAWIIRVPSNDFNRSCFVREAKLLNALPDSAICEIPRSPMIDVETSSMAYRKLRGEAAGKDQFQNVSPDQKKQLSKALGSFLAWLHSHPVSLVEYDNGTYGPDIIHHIGQRVERFGAEVAEFGKRTLEDFKDYSSNAVRRVPLHQDLQPSNCLLDADHQLVGVIDFSLSWPGDPHWDFRRLYWFGDVAIRNAAAAAYEEQGGQKIDLGVVEVLERVALLNSIIWQSPDSPTLRTYLAEMAGRTKAASQ